MSSVYFPFRPRANDLRAALVVQRNLDYLADKLKDLGNKSDSGSGSIAAGSTSTGVSFRTTIANPVVTVTPANNPGSAYWVSGKTPSGFVLNLATAAPAGGVFFDWIVRGAG